MAESNHRGHRTRHREELRTTEVPHVGLLLSFAKEMRLHPTHAEYMLWDELRATKLGVRFRQQQVIGRYIVDFACLYLKLVVEVDGGIHDWPDRIAYDEQRSNDLEADGYKVVRFRNEEVYEDVWQVAASIRAEIASLTETKES